MTSTILLIRHGETAWNRDALFRGLRDIPLNNRGRRQAEATADFLKSRRIDAAYTSPLSRAAETASIVLQHHGISAEACPGLIDFNYGDWTGVPEGEVAEKWPKEYELWGTAPHRVQIPGGDSLDDVFQRSFSAMEEIAKAHEGETAALFSHRVVNKVLVLGVLGLGLDRFPHIMQGNCCINEFDRAESGYIIKYINSTFHIAAAGIDVLQADF